MKSRGMRRWRERRRRFIVIALSRAGKTRFPWLTEYSLMPDRFAHGRGTASLTAQKSPLRLFVGCVVFLPFVRSAINPDQRAIPSRFIGSYAGSFEFET